MCVDVTSANIDGAASLRLQIRGSLTYASVGDKPTRILNCLIHFRQRLWPARDYKCSAIVLARALVQLRQDGNNDRYGLCRYSTLITAQITCKFARILAKALIRLAGD